MQQLSYIRERINGLLKQYKHNALPDVDEFVASVYNENSNGCGIPICDEYNKGLFIILSENNNFSKKQSYFLDENGNIFELGEVNANVFDNVLCNAILKNDGVWLLDLIIYDNKDFRKQNEDFRFQCLVRLTTNTTCNFQLHMPVIIRPVDKEKYPSVYEFSKSFMVFNKKET